MAIRDALPSLSHKSMQPRTFEDLKSEMERMFDGFLAPFGGTDVTTKGFFPETEIHETDKDIRISMELPGVDQKDIDISVTGEVLSVRGEKKHESEVKEEDFYRSERSFGSFQRSMNLPFGVDQSAIEASFDKGVLTLIVRKPDEVQAKTAKIKIKGA